MSVDLNLLKVFISVASQGSFARAAQQLSMPTSNVSRSIKQLEQQLNCRLIERTTRSMRLTEQGDILLKQSQRLYEELDETLDQISHREILSGALRLTIPSEAGSLLLAEIIAEFALQHPKLAIHCDTQLMPLDVINDDIDLLFTFHRGELDNSSYHSRLIKTWQSVVVASPQLIERTGRPQTIADLANMPCISSLSALSGQPWVFIDQQQCQQKININSQYRVNSGILANVAALKGVGYAILAKEPCEQEIAQGLLEVIEFDEQPAPIELRAIYASRRSLSPKIDVFLQYLLQRLA
ncbi:LysR family transcriptional regulator [Providencia stuartii]|uniref:LysR family transcriptional regulator n=2 Tax=Providencia TaxID=586 RepID=A0A1S1HR14_PROST|nr:MULTISPECIES: LysR family transcriptional regulator [Providencia]ELR5298683.1 LysR family transcriptional regulator [Providencia stuartii]MDW7587133.1 LysR family transcriptional regulator [Providencia sp. 2023EL-00965]MDX4944289.1 LysR family transcriptional regulator [Providencia manganoxydans]OHT23753.1 LysR family transcriptional regulator [Providencia stuartii]QQO60753.1 LysR family transcriptional regulator [Providencia manganoxydans]